MKRYRHYHHKLGSLLTAALVLSLFGFGCQPKMPVIGLDPIGQSGIPPIIQERGLVVGEFSCSSESYEEWGVFVGNYINNYLEANKLLSIVAGQAARDGKAGAKIPDKLLLQGQLRFIRTALGADQGRCSLHIETIFSLTDRTKGGTLQSTLLAKTTENSTPAGIREVLTGFADDYLAEIFPREDGLSGSLARGWSEHDRKGRKLASKKEYGAALGCFEKAIDARPEDHAALYNAGMMCEALRDYDRAGEYYRRATVLSDDETYREASERIERRKRR